jgi:S1-C subfamily serine protease
MKYFITLLLLSGCATTAPCKGVIGTVYSPTTHEIEYIYPNSPAQSNALQIGDIILYLGQGLAGDDVLIGIGRGEIDFEQHITLACFEDFSTWKQY